MNVFLSGPDEADFQLAAAKLRSLGLTVAVPSADPNLREAVGVDAAWTSAHAEAVALLPGWQTSSRAFAALRWAQAYDLPVINLPTADRINYCPAQ